MHQSINVSDESFNEVIPTALLTAYPRTLSNIMYAKEIFSELKAMKGGIDESLLVDSLAPEIEARSKTIDMLIGKKHNHQILELASGFSTRGMIYAEKFKANYVELDLPEVISHKEYVISKMRYTSQDLHFVKGNVLNLNDILSACKYFDKSKPITIVNEGLLRYLSFDEKKILVTNVKHILQIFGGVWVCGDGGTLASRIRQNKSIPKLNNSISEKTGRNSLDNVFVNREHIIRFFEDNGFTLDFYQYTEVLDKLFSPNVLMLDKKYVKEELLQHSNAFILKLKEMTTS